jgi:phenylacetate-CoA ligase
MLRGAIEFRGLLKNEKRSPADLLRLQEQKLRAVIQHAYGNVPYYRTLFDDAGVSPEDIRGPDDLGRIPVSSREGLKKAGVESVLAQGIDPDGCNKVLTSGTTAEPFTVYLSKRESRTRRLIARRDMLRVGVRRSDRVATLGPWEGPKTLYQRLGMYRVEHISIQLSEEEQIRRLKAFNPTVIFTFPSGLRVLLRALDYRLSTVARPRAIVTSLEVPDQVMMNRVLEDLDTEFFSIYGALEVGRLAGECPAHSGLHVNVDHVIMECLDGDRPAPPGTPGIVVLTSLTARTMPIIRYRLADWCATIEKACPCGSPFPLIEQPQGREAEIIRLPSGRSVSWMNIDYILTTLDNIDQWRIIQEAADHLVILLAFRRPPDKANLEKARLEVLKSLKEPMNVGFKLVDFIEEEGLKFGRFISRLS